MLSQGEREELITQARAAAERAYAPYSRFRVGAVVLGERGSYSGANIENASYGLSLCAERAALTVALAAGERVFRALAVACIDALPSGPPGSLMPCGACRQWISELAPNAAIVVFQVDGQFTSQELLPSAFRL